MIKARHNHIISVFFDYLMRGWLHLAFRRIHIHNHVADQGGPILLVSNHFSWWDGFIARYVNIKTFGRKLFVMMLEEQLKSNAFLRKLGAFSIKKNSRSALDSLQYAGSVLKNRNHLLLLFPQGQFQSIHTQSLSFEKGWTRILLKASPGTQLVFMACMIDYFAHRRPTLNIYLHKVSAASLREHTKPEELAGMLEKCYHAFYAECVDSQNKQTNPQ